MYSSLYMIYIYIYRDSIVVTWISRKHPQGMDEFILTTNGHRSSHGSLQVGDCLGGLQFTHLAGYQGALSAFNALQGVQLKSPKPAEAPKLYESRCWLLGTVVDSKMANGMVQQKVMEMTQQNHGISVHNTM